MSMPTTPGPLRVQKRRKPIPPAIALQLFAPEFAPHPSGDVPWQVAMPGRDPLTFRTRTWTTEAWAHLAVHPPDAQLGADGIWVQLTID